MFVFRISMLILASAMVAITAIGFVRGERYADLVANVDGDSYPLSDLYGLGFFLSSWPLLSLQGALGNKLKRQSRLYWNNIYADYYAELAWAEFLTFACLIIGFFSAIITLIDSEAAFVFVFGEVMLVAAAYNIIVMKMGEAVDKRREECEYAFPDMVAKFALLVNSGMISREAWQTVAYSQNTSLYELMQQSCNEMENGMTEVEAIYRFGILTDSDVIAKFTSAMIQSFEKGGADLATFLLGQAQELLAHKRQVALQRGEAAAAKLMIPIAMSFVGIIIVILGSALQSMSLSF